MAKKKASSLTPAKAAVKKVAVKKATAQKLAAKTGTTNTKRSKRRKADPPSYNYCLTLIGQVGQLNPTYYYELRECANGNCGDLKGVVVSKSGGLKKSCKGAAVLLSPTNLPIWENGVQVLGCK
jgi:hypothetical protein